MELAAFLDVLPHVPSQSYPIQDAAKYWAQYVNSQNERFIAPPLVEVRPVAQNETAVVIVSAPGAVGKSTVGKEIAYRQGAPIIDLAKLKVGRHEAAGLITTMFGHRNAGSAFNELDQGRLLLVFDALDETRLGSREANFDAFIEGLADLAKAPRQNPAIVLLGRTDTAAWVEAYLEELGVPIAHFSIDFFGETAAREFIVRYVTHESKGRVSISKPFIDVRDQLLTAMKNSIVSDTTDDDLARSVVGYAPVLEAVGKYLIDDEHRRNYHRLLQSLQSKGREWELLLEVAEALLEREQQKVSKQAREGLEQLVHSWAGWDAVYSPEEQAQRLLSDYIGQDHPPMPTGLPSSVRGEYEKLVRPILDEHPFRGSVKGLHPVFGEYLYARLVVENAWHPWSNHTLDQLRMNQSYLPTRALGRFVLALTLRKGDPLVTARNFGFVYESLLADQKKAGDVTLFLRDTVGQHPYQTWISSKAETVSFYIDDPDQGLWLWRRLGYAYIEISGKLELGLSGTEFKLGPKVSVACSEFISSAEMRVYAEGEEDQVTLKADSFGGMIHPPDVVGTSLSVFGSTVPWPWSPYFSEEPQSSDASQAVIDVYNHLARMLLWFQANGYQEMARVDELVEKAALGGTSEAKRLLQFCFEKGLINRGALFTLDKNRLAQYSINYVDLSRRTLKTPVIHLLEEFLSNQTS